MRKILTYILLVLLIGCAPKLSKENLESRLSDYIRLMENEEYEKAISYLPTEFWKHYKKKDFIEGFSNNPNNVENLSIDNLQIIKLSPRKKINDNYFKIIQYSTDLEYDTDKIEKRLIEKYKKYYGEYSVTIDSERNRIKIKNENSLIAVFDKEENDWKFMEFNPHITTKVYGYQTWLELH